jgi:hypothetical protein
VNPAGTEFAVPSLERLPSVIDTLITAVRNGELDEQLAQAVAKQGRSDLRLSEWRS